MPPQPARNWFVRQNGNVTGPFSEAELRKDLELLVGTGTEIRQGNSQWYAASVVRAKFQALEQQGVYLRRRGNQVEGPFTATRAIELLREDPHGEVMVGKQGHWELASIFLDQAKAKTAAMPKVSIRCVHCHKNLVMPASLVGTWATCPSCSETFRVPDPNHKLGGPNHKLGGPVPSTNPNSGDVPSANAARSPANQLPDPGPKSKSVQPSDRQTDARSRTETPPSHSPNQPAARSAPPSEPTADAVKRPIVVPASDIEVIRDPTNPTPQPASSTPQYAPVRNAPAKAAAVPSAAQPFEFDSPPPNPPTRPSAAGYPNSNPYSPANDSAGYLGSPVPGSRDGSAVLSSGNTDRSIHYVVPGVFFLLTGILYLIAMLIYLVQVAAMAAFSAGLMGPAQGAESLPGQQLAIAGLIQIAAILYCAALAYVFIAGAIAMLQRRSHQLPLARAAAVAAVIPCFGCPVLPFGIWACVSLFSDHARRDFQ